jgi:hypothetical protein
MASLGPQSWKLLTFGKTDTLLKMIADLAKRSRRGAVRWNSALTLQNPTKNEFQGLDKERLAQIHFTQIRT